MMEKMDPMKKALAMRRGQGIDIKIIVGESDGDKKTDLAPKPESPLASGADMKPIAAGSPMDQAVQGQPMEGHEDSEMDAEMLSQMSDFDKQDLAERKPRSLGERARQAAMERSKK